MCVPCLCEIVVEWTLTRIFPVSAADTIPMNLLADSGGGGGGTGTGPWRRRRCKDPHGESKGGRRPTPVPSFSSLTFGAKQKKRKDPPFLLVFRKAIVDVSQTWITTCGARQRSIQPPPSPHNQPAAKILI